MSQRHKFGGSQKGGFQKGGFGGCSPGTKTGTRVRSPKPPFWKPPSYLPMTLFGVDKRVVSKSVVSADVPPERKPERGYVRQNHPFTKPPFSLPVTNDSCIRCPNQILGPAPLQKCVGDFCCINFGGFCRGFSWRIFLGTFSHKNEEKKIGEKIREKIRRPKTKIREKSILPKTDPENSWNRCVADFRNDLETTWHRV